VNLEEVARLAGVSRSTVSRVVNGSRRVSPEARARVEAVIRTHHFHPNAAARSLASRRTRILGLLIPQAVGFVFGDPYFPNLVQGVVDAANAADHGLMLMMESSDDATTADRLYHRVIRGRHLDGVVVATAIVGDPLLDCLAADDFPTVLIGRHPAFPGLASVDVDNRSAARQAVAHLIGHGCCQIAHVSGPLGVVSAADRRDGYRDALAAAGLPDDSYLLVESDYTDHGGYRAMRRLLALPGGRPDAVFVGSDTMAVGALRALAEAGLSAPDDLALIGFDGLERHAVTCPTLSTVAQPIGELGRTAVTTLLGRVDAPEAIPVRHLLSTRLVLRGSCGCAIGQRPATGSGETIDPAVTASTEELEPTG
jgi:LacI family transcriptional regulator